MGFAVSVSKAHKLFDIIFHLSKRHLAKQKNSEGKKCWRKKKNNNNNQNKNNRSFIRKVERPNNREKLELSFLSVDRMDSTQATFICKWRVKKKGGGGKKGGPGIFFFFFLYINGTEWLKLPFYNINQLLSKSNCRLSSPL